MAVPGRTPEEGSINRNKKAFDTTYLDWDGKVRGPDLPTEMSWHPRTVIWWTHWRESPQATLMTAADWDELFMAAILFDSVMRNEYTRADGSTGRMSIQGKVQALSQVRRVTAEFGATFGDRMRLRMKIRTDLSDKEYEDSVDRDAVEIVDYLTILKNKAADLRSAEARADGPEPTLIERLQKGPRND